MNQQLKIVEWILRLGVFGTFLGHGIFALGVKQNWIPLITTFGFSRESAITIMPVIGVVDIVVAFVVLIHSVRGVLIWACFWAFATALSRFISGEPIWEFVERAANWTAPLVLLILQRFPKSVKDILTVRSVEKK